MKKVVLPGLVLALCMSVLPARAQVALDVSKVTCGQFVTYKITSPKSLAIWMSGYHHGKRGDTVIDTQQLVANADKVIAYCTKNPDVDFIQAVDSVLGPEN